MKRIIAYIFLTFGTITVIVKGADGKIENSNYLPANYHKL